MWKEGRFENASTAEYAGRRTDGGACTIHARHALQLSSVSSSRSQQEFSPSLFSSLVRSFARSSSSSRTRPAELVSPQSADSCCGCSSISLSSPSLHFICCNRQHVDHYERKREKERRSSRYPPSSSLIVVVVVVVGQQQDDDLFVECPEKGSHQVLPALCLTRPPLLCPQAERHLQ